MDASLRTVQRLLGQWAPHVPAAEGGRPTLETLPAGVESPRIARAPMAENCPFRARAVAGEPIQEFRGFLDGAQQSQVMYERGVPIVYGLAAAVIRERRDRRLVTWRRGVLQDRGVYAPVALVPEACERLADHGIDVIDTGLLTEADGVGVSPEGAHPATLTDRARRCLEVRREQLEYELADEWCASEDAPLYVDGGIGRNERTATAMMAIGVGQRHHTLYGGADAVPVLAALRAGERTTVFRPPAGHRAPVLSWYLRLRDATGREPTWGLVRVESADRAADITERADEVSRWVLAERVPLALPGERWHALAYGIRDCKEMLRAVMTIA